MHIHCNCWFYFPIGIGVCVCVCVLYACHLHIFAIHTTSQWHLNAYGWICHWNGKQCVAGGSTNESHTSILEWGYKYEYEHSNIQQTDNIKFFSTRIIMVWSKACLRHVSLFWMSMLTHFIIHCLVQHWKLKSK